MRLNWFILLQCSYYNYYHLHYDEVYIYVCSLDWQGADQKDENYAHLQAADVDKARSMVKEEREREREIEAFRENDPLHLLPIHPIAWALIA